MADPNKELRVKISTSADLNAAKEADETLDRVVESGEALGAAVPQEVIPATVVPAIKEVEQALDRTAGKARELAAAMGSTDGASIIPPEMAQNAAEAEAALQKLSAEEERLLKLKSQFLTVAEAEVAEVERLAAAAQREAAAKAEAAAATAMANTALNQNAAEAEAALQKLSAEEERLLKLKSQFLTAAEAEVAEVERLAAAAQREAAAKAEAAAATATANAALNQTANEAAKTAKSIDQLEDELRDLQRQLSGLPVGGREFTALAGRVKEAEAALTKAEAEARRLGGTVGRRGNAGMAVLEFSRAFEDAQYGIRGVLNNIPGLIAMLGGSAGLAGVISIAAVAGTQLWERMGSGAKAAKDPLEHYKKALEETRAVFAELEQESQKQRDAASKEAGRTTADALSQINLRSWFDQQSQSLEKLKIQSEGRLAIARQELEILRIDAELKISSGDQALTLAEKRRAAIEQIRQIEREITEEMRRQDEIAALRGWQTAIDQRKEVENELGAKERISQPLVEELGKLEEERAAMIRKRIETEKRLEETIRKNAEDQSIHGFSSDVVPASQMIAEAEIKQLREAIKKLKIEDAKFEGEIKEKTPGMEKAVEETRAAAERLNQASQDLQKKTEELKNTGAANDIASNEDKGMDEIDRRQKEIEQRERVREAEKSAADGIAQMIADISARLGDAANSPNVQANVGRLEDILKDGFQVGEQNEVTNMLLRLSGEMKVGYLENQKVVQGIHTLVSSSVGKLIQLQQTTQNIQSDHADRLNRLESQFSY